MVSEYDKKPDFIAELIKRKLEARLALLYPELKGQISLMLDPVSLSIKKEEVQSESTSASGKERVITSGKCYFNLCFNGQPLPNSKLQVVWKMGKLYFNQREIAHIIEKRKKLLFALARLSQQPLPYLSCFALQFNPADERALGLFRDFLKRSDIVLRESELKELLYFEYSRQRSKVKEPYKEDICYRLAESLLSGGGFNVELSAFFSYLKDTITPFKLEELEHLIDDIKAVIKMEEFNRKVKLKNASRRSKSAGYKKIAASIEPAQVAQIIDDMLVERGLWGLKLIYFCLNYQGRKGLRGNNSTSTIGLK